MWVICYNMFRQWYSNKATHKLSKTNMPIYHIIFWISKQSDIPEIYIRTLENKLSYETAFLRHIRKQFILMYAMGICIQKYGQSRWSREIFLQYRISLYYPTDISNNQIMYNTLESNVTFSTQI